MQQNPFHFTIGAGPAPDLNLDEHLDLVKIALLYADRATLFSSAYDVLINTLPRGNLLYDKSWTVT